jgi:penicillin-insensitive murein endopeptidase
MLWDASHARVLEAAARDPRVDRIFVNAHIKQELCRSVRGDRSWLRKIRPWHRHDDHFHMRLACPADSPDCIPQKPLAPGDGCDASLDWWLSLPPLRPLPENHHGPAPSPALPRACRAVLSVR